MKAHASVIVASLFALVLLTACGGGGASTTINVSLIDFQFSPNTFTVPAGKEITINVINNGAVVHDFVIMKHGTTVGESYDDEDLPNVYWKIEVQPGKRTSATFTAPSEPGEYQVVCGTKGHFQSGMIAKLTVVAQ